MADISYVFDDEHCLGFVERINNERWRAIGARHLPSRISIIEIGYFSTLRQARDAIRIRALLWLGTSLLNRP
jgi:hypothetical protein